MIVTSCTKPETRTRIDWKIAGSLPPLTEQKALGVAGPVSGFSGNQLLIAGGANFPERLPWEGGAKKYHDAVYLFDPASGTFNNDAARLRLPHPVAYAATAVADDRIVYAGGENEAGISDKVYMLQWDGKELQTTSLPMLPLGLTNAAMTYHEETLYLTGGETATETSDKFWRLSLRQPEAGWQPLAPMPHPSSHAVQLILRNRGQDWLFVFGGRCKNRNGISTLHKAVFAFHLKTGEWQQKKPLPYSLAAGSGIVTPDNQALLFGGDKGSIFRQVETLIAQAATLEGAARDSVILRKNRLQSTHAGFSRSVLQYQPENDAWDVLSEIPFPVPVTTTALYDRGKIYITSGEMKPGVRTPHILEGTMIP
ncbi:hypothetical protein ACFPMF_13660 [Larkinella bovis]|uniref:Galactose oxidase n=1 Tax=Larkinella bovis TaxID=683041 RepID=A0ABW0IE20_9BACT